MIAYGIAIILLSNICMLNAATHNTVNKNELNSKVEQLKNSQTQVLREIDMIEKRNHTQHILMTKLTKDYFVESIRLDKINSTNAEILNKISGYISLNYLLKKPDHQQHHKTKIWLVNNLIDAYEKQQQHQINIEFNQKAMQRKVESLKDSIKYNKIEKSQKLATLSKQKELLNITLAKIKEIDRNTTMKKSNSPSKKLITLQRKLAPPIKGNVSTPFGTNLYKTAFTTQHIEIRPQESSVRAINDGKVVLSKHVNGFGHMIVIAHEDDFFSIYAHCDTVLVAENKYVKLQQKIAEVKNSTLYFAMRHKQVAIDPKKYIKL